MLAAVIGQQLITPGEPGNLSDARRVVANMSGMKRCDPDQSTEQIEAFRRYKQL
jgi:hypothetical protein